MIEKKLNNYKIFSYSLIGDELMKHIKIILKKLIFGSFLLYGYNLIASNFNMIIPINIFTLLFIVCFGVPSILVLLLFKLFIL